MNFKTKDMVKASFFIALGLVLPFAFHVTGMGGQIFLPMHIPVLLCGLILGAKYGIIVGVITPILSSAITGMPPMIPGAVFMMFELGTYGFISGYLYKGKKLNLYVALIAAMLLGRFVSGIAHYTFLIAHGNDFVLKGFLAGAFITSFPGILVQIIFIPVIVKALSKFKEVSLNA